MTTYADLTARLNVHLRRTARRVRMRRLVLTLEAHGLALAVIGAVAASLSAAAAASGAAAGAADGAAQFLALLRPFLIAEILIACAIAWMRGTPHATLAREMDRRLGLADRTATALAIARGTVASTLADRVLADTSTSLDAAAVELAQAFPSRPRRGVLVVLRVAGVIVAAWVAAALLALLLGSGGGGSALPLLPGAAPRAAETAEQQEPEVLGAGDAPPEEQVDDQPDEPQSPDAEPPAEPDPPPPPEPEPDAPPAGPPAVAELVLSATEFEPGDDVLALGVAKPGAGLSAPAGFTLTIEIDGKALATGDSVALDPANERGTLTPLRLGLLAGAAELLTPGEHEAVLVLTADGADGGAAVRSEPRTFRIRGDQKNDPDGKPPPPEPEAPPPQPEEPPPPEPAGPPPQGGGVDEDPPEEAEPPPLPMNTERKVVVPLFAEGEEIEKIGPRLVLAPGGGPESPPERVPLEKALEDAQRRAEEAVDRAGVRAADRDLVRRYFERLRRLSEGGR